MLVEMCSNGFSDPCSRFERGFLASAPVLRSIRSKSIRIISIGRHQGSRQKIFNARQGSYRSIPHVVPEYLLRGHYPSLLAIVLCLNLVRSNASKLLNPSRNNESLWRQSLCVGSLSLPQDMPVLQSNKLRGLL